MKLTRFAQATVALALGLSATSCSSGTESPSDSTPERTIPPETKAELATIMLVTLKTSGGMCADGPCPEVFTMVRGDGMWNVSDGKENRSGTIDDGEMIDLIELVESTPEEVEKKDKKSCESWVDGRDLELVYTTPEGETGEFSSCTHHLEDLELISYVVDLTK